MTTYAVSGSPSVCIILSAVFGGSTEYVLDINQGTIDATSDDSEQWGEYLAGLRGWSVKISGLYLYADSAQTYIEQHLIDEAPIKVVVMFTPEDEKVFQGNGIITNLSYLSGFEDVIKINIDVQGTGLLVATES